MRLSEVSRFPLVILIVGILAQFQFGCTLQRTFATPDQAVTSLVDSIRADNDKELMQILGSEAKDLLYSGDTVVDKETADRFLTAYDQKHHLTTNDDGSLTLCIGDEDWPMPIPLVKKEGKDQWKFDTEAGKDEILNRRIGRDELDTIQVCMAIVDAQREYAQLDPEKTGMPCYAQKFLSDPGKKNGLYWETKAGEKASPLGDLVGKAQLQGYTLPKAPAKTPQPYRGYLYRMLKSQGPDAEGGARDYLMGDKMLGGYAAIATPASYGNSGIMTFIVNQDGDVYQKDLGPDTEKLVQQINTYNPDSSWKKIASAADATPPDEQ